MAQKTPSRNKNEWGEKMTCEAAEHKHAYLIMAHDKPRQLEILLSLLDDPRNDIYLHLDSRLAIDLSAFSEQVCHSNLFFVERDAVRWGHSSLVVCELKLLTAAVNKQAYEFYHLLSGADLPLYTQELIHSFFDVHAGEIFLAFDNFVSKAERDRVALYHPFVGRRGRHRSLSENAKFALDVALEKLQGFLRIDRIPAGIEIKKGSQWFSIPDGLACDVVNHSEEIMRMCRYSNCADEVFLQTFVWNSAWRENLFLSGVHLERPMERSMRLIDWEKGGPYTWTIGDYEELSASEMMFARKFDIDVDERIIFKLATELMK